jgi:acyl-CoA reductase-like NAD-dependent aldehyde dehydrogenase
LHTANGDDVLTTAGLELPELSPAALGDIAVRLREAAPRLRQIPVEERVAVIDRVAARWLNPSFPLRRLAVERLPLVTGYPARAVGLALDHLWSALRARELGAVVRTELDAPLAAPPDLAFHVLAGNVPGAGVFGLIAALLAGVPSLVKAARREPLLPALVASSIADEDARLGAALAVTPWAGGDTGLDGAAIAAAELVLAYGRSETLTQIAAHDPRHLLRFGPRVSVGLVAREAVDRQTAAACALQVALFDQQGCLSPQIVLVEESDRAVTERFVAAVMAELARLQGTLPRAPLSLPEATAGWRHLEHARWRAQEGAALAVHADPLGRFSVICDRTGVLPTTPLNRHLILVPVAALAAAGTTLRSITGCVEAVGYAGPEARLTEAVAVAVACEAPRLCPLGRLQRPPFGWRQSGHARLGCFAAPAEPLPAARAADTAA